VAESLPRNGGPTLAIALYPGGCGYWPNPSPGRPISSPALADFLPRSGRFPPPQIR